MEISQIKLIISFFLIVICSSSIYKEFQTFIEASDDVTATSISNSGNIIVTGSNDKKTRIYQLIHNQYHLTQTIYASDYVQSTTLSDDGFILSIAEGKEIKVYKLNNEQYQLNQIIQDSTALVWQVQLSKDGQYLLAGCSDNKARIYISNGSSYSLLQTISNSEALWSVGFAKQGKYLFTGGYDNITRVYQLKGTQFIFQQSLTEAQGNIIGIDVTNNGKYLVTGSWDSDARVYELINGSYSFMAILKQPIIIWSVDITNDGKYIYIGGSNNIHVYENKGNSYALVDTIKEKGHIWSVSISQDTNYLVSGSSKFISKVYLNELLQISDPTVETETTQTSQSTKIPEIPPQQQVPREYTQSYEISLQPWKISLIIISSIIFTIISGFIIFIIYKKIYSTNQVSQQSNKQHLSTNQSDLGPQLNSKPQFFQLKNLSTLQIIQTQK